MLSLEQLFTIAIERDASDIHLIPGYCPTIRVKGEMISLRAFGVVPPEDTQEVLPSILLPWQLDIFRRTYELDFAYSYGGMRFRVNYYVAQRAWCASFRLIPSRIKTYEELNLPKEIFQPLTALKQGLVLVTGPTGEGKSTTLAAVLNDINLNQTRHIITVEDPIEFIYPKAQSLISQRELGIDTSSWTGSLRGALREDPDVVFIGELRDYETIAAAVTIAETGHLVFSTLHSGSTTETINRMIDVFPSHQQSQIRGQLSQTLKAVIAQRLLPRFDGRGRIVGLEVLISNQGVAALIRDGKTHLLDNMLETSEESGMILFEKYLARLVSQGYISPETAFAYAIRPFEIDKFVTPPKAR